MVGVAGTQRRNQENERLQQAEYSKKTLSADKTSSPTTDTYGQTYTVSAGRKESKQTVQSIRSLNNQISNICVSSALFKYKILNNYTTN